MDTGYNASALHTESRARQLKSYFPFQNAILRMCYPVVSLWCNNSKSTCTMKQDSTATKQSSTKSYTWLIYLIAWLVIVLIQSILIGQSVTTAANFWEAPSYYLSTWLLDIFLILIFYLNYYYVAGHMMRRRHFGGYIAFVVIVAVVALFMPIRLQRLNCPQRLSMLHRRQSLSLQLSPTKRTRCE